MHCRVRADRFFAAVVVGLMLGAVTQQAFGQNRLSRSLDGPVTADSVERALILIPDGASNAAVNAANEIGLSLRVQFRLDSADLTAAAMGDLDQVALAFNRPQLATSALTLEGHTDSSGDAGYNQRLSQRRADAVVAYLVARGVAPNRLRAVGYGESRPLLFYSASDPRQRRVEIVRQF